VVAATAASHAVTSSSTTGQSTTAVLSTADLNRKAREELARLKQQAKRIAEEQQRELEDTAQAKSGKANSESATSTTTTTVNKPTDMAIPITSFANETSSESSDSSDEEKASKKPTANPLSSYKTTVGGEERSAVALKKIQSDVDDENERTNESEDSGDSDSGFDHQHGAGKSGEEKKPNAAVLLNKIKALKQQQLMQQQAKSLASKKRPIIKSSHLGDAESSGVVVKPSFIGPKLPRLAAVTAKSVKSELTGSLVTGEASKEDSVMKDNASDSKSEQNDDNTVKDENKSTDASMLVAEKSESCGETVTEVKKESDASSASTTTTTSLIDRTKLNYSKDELAKYDHLFRKSQMYAAAVTTSSSSAAASPSELTATSPTSVVHAAASATHQGSFDFAAGAAAAATGVGISGGVVAGVAADAVLHHQQHVHNQQPTVSLPSDHSSHHHHNPHHQQHHQHHMQQQHQHARLLTGPALTVGAATKLDNYQQALNCKIYLFFY
jgi:hypothetical protein